MKRKIAHMTSLICCLLILIGCSGQSDLKPKKTGYVEIDQGKIFYQQFGDGAPMLVIHGGPGLDQTYLLPQMLELAKDHEVTFYDQRGSGKSLQTPMDVSHLNLDQFTKDIEAVRQATGREKIILVGHSFGGRLAMNYAIKHPDHVSRLILINSAPADYKGQQAFFEELTIRTKPLADKLTALSNQEIFDKLSAEELQILFRNLFSVYFYNPKDVDKLTLTMSAESAQSGAKVRQILSWYSPDLDVLADLKTLKVPTLIIHGSADVIPEWTAHDLNHTIPHSELYVIENCGHFPYIEKPDQLFVKIKNFVLSDK